MSTRVCWIVVACAALAGCATPQPVLDLADKTSANVGIVSTRLRQLSDESNRLYASRAENISRMQAANTTARANLAYDVALTQKSGEGDDLALMADLQAWVKSVDQIFVAAAEEEKKRRDALLAGQTTIDTKSQALQKVAETLAALARQESVADRVRLLQKFVTEVRDDLKKELDNGSESSKQAKALLDQLGVSFKGP
jgi:ribosomal protein L17